MDHLVTLDAFSGLPNPQWRLSEDEAKLFDEIVEGLERRDAPAPAAPGLGFRGFEVFDNANGTTTRVYASSVVHQSQSGAVQLHDPAKRLEDLLIDSLRANLRDDPRLAPVIELIKSNRNNAESDK
jgi:hypothetical protein